MRKVLVVAAVLAVLAATQTSAQVIIIPDYSIPAAAMLTPFPVSYDPFFVLPGAAKSMGVDAGISSSDVTSLGDVSDVWLIGKYSVDDRIELGARATFGFLRQGGDALSSALVGAKYGLSEKSAATANFLIPVGNVDDPGLSVGYMQSMQAGTMNVDGALQVGLLKGFAPKGAALDLLVEPSMPINEKMTGYVDVIVRGNTKKLGDNINIDLLPYVDYKIEEGLVGSAGVSINAYNGTERSSDIGLRVALIKTMSK